MREVRERDWPIAKHVFDQEWLPILLALDSKQLLPDLQSCLRNYLIISMVSTIETMLWNLAARNIDVYDLNLSKVVEGTITIPLDAIEKIRKGKATKGAMIAANFNFANPNEIDFFFSNILNLKFLNIIRELDRLDRWNYVKSAFNLNRNWNNFMDMFSLRNRVVHEKINVKMTDFQLKSLVNCTMNFLDACAFAGWFEFRVEVDARLAWLRQREAAKRRKENRVKTSAPIN